MSWRLVLRDSTRFNGRHPTNRLDRSGDSVFRIKPGAAKVALIRAARSILTLGRVGAGFT